MISWPVDRPRGRTPATSRTSRFDEKMRKLLLSLLLPITACGAEQAGYQPLRTGDPAPDYAAPTLAGDTIRLADLAGRPVMLNVWATWCPPCREEMPALQQLYERFEGRGLRIVGVSVDSRGAEAAIARFVDEGGYTFTILHDPAEEVSRAFRTNGVPETYLIGADGRIVRRWIGPFDPLAEDVVRDVEAALAAGVDAS